MALVGLLVLSAFSLATASGSEPRVEEARTTIRMLTDAEVAQVRQRLPSLQPQSQVVGQLESELLERLFPSVSFYKALRSDVLPPLPYLIAASGDKLLGMPYGFNRLLAENNMRTSDENIVMLGKAFVVLAVGNEPIKNRGGAWVRTARLDTFPPVAFLEATTSRPVIDGDYYDARLTVRIGEQTEEWYFRVWQNQFSFVLRRNAEGPVNEYLPATVESLPSRGQLELTPDTLEQQK
jgi:hypothetical protein